MEVLQLTLIFFSYQFLPEEHGQRISYLTTENTPERDL